MAVIKQLDLTIEDGEFFTFVGPSGCGKSTILNMIAGLEDVTRGTIYFDKMRINELSPRDRDVAMVFQSYALYPHMTVFDNIAFPLRMRKMKGLPLEREVKAVAEMLGLEDKLGRRPKELSGGERQRVALGRAVIRRPKVFLLDEPLSNLDARLRIEMRAELKRLHRELSVTTVYVTHDQAEAMGLSERIAVLNEGTVQQTGAPADVYLQPANMFVAGFMGSPPMNFIPARLLGRDPLEIEIKGLKVSPELREVADRADLAAGIRPEDITIAAYGDRETSGDASGHARNLTSAWGEVTLIEPAGSFNWVDVSWQGVAVKGTSGVDTDVRLGSPASLSFPLERVHFFDAATGKRIS